jgi:hypothetical protein
VLKVEEKRCYSLNQAAYLIYLGHTYKINFDKESAKFYVVFPQSDQVKKDIYEYKSTDVVVSLKGFTHAYKQLRDEINAIRFSDALAVKYSMCKIRSICKDNEVNKKFMEKKDKFIEEYYEENYFDGVRMVDEDEFK